MLIISAETWCSTATVSITHLPVISGSELSMQSLIHVYHSRLLYRMSPSVESNVAPTIGPGGDQGLTTTRGFFYDGLTEVGAEAEQSVRYLHGS